MTIDQDNLAARFLLGKLSEEEALTIEENYFRSRNFFEELLAAENDLIDAYAMGRLSTEDRSFFETRLLLNPQQRERVRFAETLVEYASSQILTAEDFESNAAVKSSWFSSLARLLSGRPLLSTAFAAAALVIFGAAVWLLTDKSAPIGQINEIAVIETPSPLPAEPPRAATPDQPVKPTPTTAASPSKSVLPPEKKEKPAVKAPSVIYSLILSPGLTRNAGTSQRFNIPAKTDYLKMRLKIEQGGFSSYHAALETVEGRQVWSGKLKAAPNTRSLEVLIPAKLLRKADYILMLKGVNEDGVYERVEDYTFTIYP